jgi:uncharacterized protein YndB with AHSA1/START domain
MQTTATATVKAPIEHVWSVVADHEGIATWAPGLKVRLDEAGAEERNGVGAVRRIETPGPAPAIVERITAFEPSRRLAYEALSGVPFRGYAGEVVLTPTHDGTRVAWTLRYEPRLPGVEKLPVSLVNRVLLNGLVRAARRGAPAAPAA